MRYLPDAVGFAKTLRDPAFRSYADLVVMPSYDTHVAGEWLGRAHVWLLGGDGRQQGRERGHATELPLRQGLSG